MVVVSITRLRVRHWRYLPAFYIQAFRSALQAKAAAGNLAVAITSEARNTFWTRSIWESEAALRAFMLAGAHRQVMPKLAKWCDEASVARWTQESAQLPSWADTHQRMLTDGRASRVAHPSPDHLSNTIPAPQVRPGQELVFK